MQRALNIFENYFPNLQHKTNPKFKFFCFSLVPDRYKLIQYLNFVLSHAVHVPTHYAWLQLDAYFCLPSICGNTATIIQEQLLSSRAVDTAPVLTHHNTPSVSFSKQACEV